MPRSATELERILSQQVKTAREYRAWAEALKDAKSQPEAQVTPRTQTLITRPPAGPLGRAR